VIALDPSGCATPPAHRPGDRCDRRAPDGRGERGAALLVVMVTVALVTALAMDLAYQARIGLQIAANGRDELVATAQARGAVNLSRLVLYFQSQLDSQASAAAGVASQIAGSRVAGAAAAAAAAGSMPRIQIWKLVPIDSMLVSNLFGAAARGSGSGSGSDSGPGPGAGRGRQPGDGVPAFRDGAGADSARFSAVIDDEDRKVNVQLDALATSGLLGAQAASFLALVADRRWDPLFEREDANGVKQSRGELAAALKDWVDEDSQQSALTGLLDRPFENGFGDENYLYDRGPDRYKAKNARFDSVEELFLVAGFSDLHMAAFGERLTVYPARGSQMNVNADDPVELLRNARIMADPPLQPIFSDPTFPDRLVEAVKLVRVGGLLTMTPQQFATVLTSLGVGVHADYAGGRNIDRRGAFTDRSYVFRIRGQGSAGSVVKNIEAVVSFEPSQAREDATDLGRIIHWREE
jgi:general secretion pathway protein K